MPISVNPILPVLAAQGAAAPELALQPGTVVDAKVLQLLADNLVRIAIASISIDVLSEVPLQAGQTLQLAVSQTEGGIRLALVGQGAGAAVTDSVSLAPAALADAVANPSATATPLKSALTPLEGLAAAAECSQPAGRSVPAVRQSRRRGDEWPAAKAAAGGDAIAGAAHQPRSESDRRRDQGCGSGVRD